MIFRSSGSCRYTALLILLVSYITRDEITARYRGPQPVIHA